MAERGWPYVAACLAATGGLVLLVGYAWQQRPDAMEQLDSAASRAEVDRAHRALHQLGEECAPGTEPADVTDAVDTIAWFATTYPDGRFPIDDETGTSVSLLLVARNALAGCAPDDAARLDALLPAELRQWSTPSPR